MKFSTPLRYPGGKAKLTDFLKLLITENELLGCDYVEAYAGGAGIAINLLSHGYANRIHLNDLNPSVFAFWHSVVNSPDELCKLINDIPVSIEQWHLQKQIQKNAKNHSSLELGFSTFFLNRTNRSGIIQAGVIGGKNQDGIWKLDARFNKADLIARIERIAQFQSKINLYNLDGEVFIKSIIPKLPQKSLVYLDPPYYVKGQGLYENHYTHEDHLKIANLVLNRLKRPWLVSYDFTPEIVDMYPSVSSIVYGLNYSAQQRYEGAEVMFFSEKLTVPDVLNPAKLKAA
jgi:DNA adenine methylase